jgi:hypothetical protein
MQRLLTGHVCLFICWPDFHSFAHVVFPDEPSLLSNIWLADSFTLTLPLDLGQLQRLRIRHDSKGSLQRWHLAHVAVTKKDGSMAPPVTFPCSKYFQSQGFCCKSAMHNLSCQL